MTATRTPTGVWPSVLHLADDARVQAGVGALILALIGPLIALADTTSATSTFYRSLMAIPVLALMLVVRRRLRPHPDSGDASPRRARTRAGHWWRSGRWHLLAGVFLGVDMTLWTESIFSVGAGVSTVLVNVQIVAVPLLTMALFGERVPRRFWVGAPILLIGVGLAGGLGSTAAAGADPVYGTFTCVMAGLAYAIYLVLFRRTGSPQDRIAALIAINVATSAVGLTAGLATSTLDLTPAPTTLGWLLLVAVTGQILGWLLVGAALPRLSASTGATLLLLHPIGTLAISVAVLGERPNGLQLIGCAVVLLAMVLVAKADTPTASPQRHEGLDPLLR